ncbi:alcohol dehydrogenase [Trichonephila clavata]|uniref:Alcohol dehydrogenase n=1 Tax=Trichonephila clavata TaxID=2740835 RepID=A0A8X6LTJ7_TRICU|nr:alcohol dehydrogenase [Trichonephila clavata]
MDEDDGDATGIYILFLALKTAVKLGTTKPLLDLGAKLYIPHFKHCSNYSVNLADEKDLECWIRTTALTAYHPVGTCAMESKTANIAGVVDRRLR